MRWKSPFPGGPQAHLWAKTQRSRMVPKAQGPTAAKKVALQLIIRGEIIDMSAVPDPGEPFAVEELAQGFDPRRISMVIENLTATSPIVWLAAVEKRDCKIKIEISGGERAEKRTLKAVIVSRTIVPLRALFDSAQIPMTSGCSVDITLLEDSGPIRVFRQVRRCRRILQ